MRCSFVDSLTWVYPDSEIGPKPCLYQVIDTARGGTVAATILLKGVKPGATIRQTVRPAGKVAFFRLVDVPVEKNTGLLYFVEKEGERNEFVTRRAPFRVYDAMQPVGASFKARATTEVLRIHIPIPANAKPGKREYNITIQHEKVAHEFTLLVTVHRAVIPPVGRDSWHYTNWFDLKNMATRHQLKPWSAGHWSIIRQYAELMARNRQNTFLFSFHDVFTIEKDALVLNRPRLRRLVKTFTDAGLYYIEGAHFGARTGGAWTSPTFSVALTKRLATSPEGDADIACAARQLMEEIETNHWRDRYLQHVADEPIKENAADYRIFVGMVRKYMPGIPIVDAAGEPSLRGSVDIWCPQVQDYQRNRASFEDTRTSGDRIWFYTCCCPGGPWLNRLLDMELLRPALFGWAGSLFQLDGFLHWGLNQYQKNQDPFEMTVIPNWGGGANSLPPGDTHVVYPGTDGPWSSVRLEAQREGIEDLELLRRLKPKQAASIVQSVIRGFDDYTKDLTVFRAARRKLLLASH